MTKENDDRQQDLELTSGFRFRCHEALACFTKCCRDVNIFLTPLDILRIKNHLRISSEAFLKEYTRTLIPEPSGFPVVILRMREERDNTCPFVTESGCTIYRERPWSCRMYPLDRADREGRYRIIADQRFCLGLGEGPRRAVHDYLCEQGIETQDEKDDPMMQIATHPRFAKEKISNPKVQEMCRMALYDLDRFRRFVLESRFLEIFHVAEDVVQKIKGDDRELLNLAYRWLEFGLLDGSGMKIREDLIRAGKKGS